MNGIRLQVIEWRRESDGEPPLVFLTGLGTSPHIFDSLAPKVGGKRRVLGLTRRGLAPSDAPAIGYDVDTLVSDITGALDVLGIQKAVLIGWSIAGMEMTRLAELHPDRVAGLVYLDAAYQYEDLARIWPEDPINSAPMESDNASLRSSRRWFENTFGFWTPAVEADARAVNLQANGSMRPNPLRPEVSAKLLQEMVRFRPRYSAISAPILTIYAGARRHPHRRAAVNAKQAEEGDAYWRERYLPLQKREMNRLLSARPDATIVTIPEAGHLCFLSQPDERRVVRALNSFLEALSASAPGTRPARRKPISIASAPASMR